MHLESLSLTHFRNYTQEQVSFGPGLNLLAGPNGHGKTNLLEAIHYACLAHSQRTRKDKDLIEWEQPAFVLRIEGRRDGLAHAQSVEYAESGAKRVKVNGGESKRLSDLIGHFSVVSFSPEDLDLIRLGPEGRRRFLDVLICQCSLDYVDVLRRYNQALKQRNSLLRSDRSSGGPRFAEDVLRAYDEPLCESGARVTWHRRRILEELAPLMETAYAGFGAPGEYVQMSLSTSVSEPGLATGDRVAEGVSGGAGAEASEVAGLKAEMLRKLLETRALERISGATLIGPHREDLLFLLAGKTVREFGSQGQKRSVALSLKLASARLLEEKNRQPPILLLDDVFAELDETRRAKIGALIKDRGQVFIANPRPSDLPFEAEKVIRLERGRVVY